MADPAAEPYDPAPAPVIIVEAGGRFSDFAGRDGAFRHGNGLATNGRIHAAFLNALAGT